MTPADPCSTPVRNPGGTTLRCRGGVADEAGGAETRRSCRAPWGRRSADPGADRHHPHGPMSGSAGHDRGRRALALGVGVALAMVYLAGAALDATSPGPRRIPPAGAAPTGPTQVAPVSAKPPAGSGY
jgi:hypothetical protein